MAGVSKGGRASLGTRSCLQGLVCYTFCGGRRRKGLAEGQRKDFSVTPGQAGFAGRMAQNTGACEKQSPPVRQRLRALGWSEAEEKRAQPSCRRYIKTLVPRLSSFAFFHPPCSAFFVFQFLTHGCFSHFSFSDLNRFTKIHSQMKCPRSLFSNSARIVFEKTSPEINCPFVKNVCGMESRRCANAVSSIPLARLSDK